MIAPAQHGEASGGSVFQQLFSHLNPHEEFRVTVAGLEIPVFNLQYFQVAAAVLVCLLFAGAARGVGSSKVGRVRRIQLGWVEWIRDEMVYSVMGPERGRPFLPFFLCIFFFILACNFFGLLPSPLGVTATANLFVTGGLAAITLFAVPICGMVAQGPLLYWKNLVPGGVPLLLWPLMFFIECLGLLAKPFALTVRLFANMTAGHLIVLSFVGLLYAFGATLGTATYAIAPVAIAFGAFILVIESFVALLQAYIFTLLSIVFVGAAVHPEH